jgi:hypothetical protein
MLELWHRVFIDDAGANSHAAADAHLPVAVG